MNIKYKFIILASVISLHIPVLFAQTAEWLVAPKYSKIEFLAPGMYKVLLGGKYGVVDNKGNMVLAPEYDEIKPFYEGVAVFGDYSHNGFAFKGLLKENGEMQFVKGKYYLNPYYEFYSDGFIPVQDEKGKYGYLDDRCNPVFKFTNDETRPFVEGIAPIGKGEDFYWLTSTGEPIYLTLKNGKIPYGGTNFYNGIAYLWDNDGKFYTIDENGKITKANINDLMVDYLYRAGSNKGIDVEYSYYKPLHDKEWKPTQKNGLWSYVDAKGKPLAPFQYDQVEDFSEGTAIAAINGKWGLLHIVADNSTFYTKANKKRYTYSPGKDCQLKFKLSIPEKWKSENLTVLVKDKSTGTLYDLKKELDDTYAFSYRPSVGRGEEQKTFNVEVKNKDIPIWVGEESYTLIPQAKLQVSLKLNNSEANANDLCTVTATIKNPSSIAVTTTVTLSGGGSNANFNGKTVTVEVPPHGSKSVSGTFLVKKVVLGGWCSVSTSNGASAKRTNLELKPH